MNGKFWRRTLRNLVFRNRPFFAHLALTHSCNLKCSFCHIPDEKTPEQDTEAMKKIIDKLDRLGIAILSISGGGEPLIRSDFAAILNHAADRGLYVKITSNGTMSLAKYRELLATRVSEISISLDGVEGNELPYAHVGPKLLESLAFLNDRLPAGMALTINVTVSPVNVDRVSEIAAFCAERYPRARVWLNPVVVGEGKLRVAGGAKVDPGFMRRVKSATLVAPAFYRKGCEDYYRNETYNWGCKAGEFFFDIKPNGDFWICQDHPAKTPLNILDDDFEERRRRSDFSHRRACSGCTYSSYWVTQKSFDPRSWVGLGQIWWRAKTNPDDPCRKTTERYGWPAGVAHLCLTRVLVRVSGRWKKGSDNPPTVVPR